MSQRNLGFHRDNNGPATRTMELPASDEVATSITGGNIRPRDGSGTLTFKADQVEAGDDVSRITLIYEADTALSGVTLEVDVKGIQLVDDDDNVKPDITLLQDEDDDLYGFVDEGTGTTSDPGLTLTEDWYRF